MIQKKSVRLFTLIMLIILTVFPPISLAMDEKHLGPILKNNTLTNSIGMEFVHVPPGNFLMGSPLDEPGREDNETLHQVVFTKGFFIQTTEVTQKQWQAVMGGLPLYLRKCDANCPVDRISWNDAQDFIEKLNNLEKTHRYKLPTEAEWEYAARAGSKTAYANGSISKLDCGYDVNLFKIGWYCGNSSKFPHHPVAQKSPNEWGLYDMHGSVWEWCEDWFSDYPAASVIDPTGPPDGSERVLRGGSSADEARACRSANRIGMGPDIRFDNIGLRLLKTP